MHVFRDLDCLPQAAQATASFSSEAVVDMALKKAKMISNDKL